MCVAVCVLKACTQNRAAVRACTTNECCTHAQHNEQHKRTTLTCTTYNAQTQTHRGRFKTGSGLDNRDKDENYVSTYHQKLLLAGKSHPIHAVGAEFSGSGQVQLRRRVHVIEGMPYMGA